MLSGLEYEINRNQGGATGLWGDLYNALAGAYKEHPANERFSSLARITIPADGCRSG
jgi:hypothetical protein